MIRKDMNGNEHKFSNMMPLSTQQPNCKYLLPASCFLAVFAH